MARAMKVWACWLLFWWPPVCWTEIPHWLHQILLTTIVGCCQAHRRRPVWQLQPWGQVAGRAGLLPCPAADHCPGHWPGRPAHGHHSVASHCPPSASPRHTWLCSWCCAGYSQLQDRHLAELPKYSISHQMSQNNSVHNPHLVWYKHIMSPLQRSEY